MFLMRSPLDSGCWKAQLVDSLSKVEAVLKNERRERRMRLLAIRCHDLWLSTRWSELSRFVWLHADSLQLKWLSFWVERRAAVIYMASS